MNKLLTLAIVGVVTFIIVFIVFFALSLPVLKAFPPEITGIVWLVDFIVSAFFAASALRMVADAGKRK